MAEKRFTIGIGEMTVAGGDAELVTHALGSCVGLCLYDPNTHLGGMAHILLPDSRTLKADMPIIKSTELGKYADIAVGELLRLLLRVGANQKAVYARIYGAANMFGFGANHAGMLAVGKMNETAVLAHLQKLHIPIKQKETGGNLARTIAFSLPTGEVTVKTSGYKK